MYLLELSSPKEAVIALLNLHSFVLPDGNRARLSSTTPILWLLLVAQHLCQLILQWLRGSH